MYRAVLLFFACIFGLQVQASQMGDDGLHKAPWMRETFKDLREDLEDANLEGKRLLLLIEQRGCVYCRKMHEQVFADPEVKALLEDKYFVVQLNMFGDVEVTDFDGTALPEKEMAKRWRLFSITVIYQVIVGVSGWITKPHQTHFVVEVTHHLWIYCGLVNVNTNNGLSTPAPSLRLGVAMK